MTRRLLLVLIVLLLTAPTYARSGIEGSYTCKGETPNGAYTLDMSVTKENVTYILDQDINGEHAAIGRGILIGSVLSVTFQTGNGFAVAHYTVKPEMLDGIWAPLGFDGVATEVCTLRGAKAA